MKRCQKEVKTRSKSLLQRCNIITDWSLKLTWVCFSSLFIPCFVERFLKILLQSQVAQELCQKGECWTAIRFDCKWLTTLNSIFRSADTALVDQGADQTDEQVQTKIFQFVSNEFTILGRAGKRFKIRIKVLLTLKSRP